MKVVAEDLEVGDIVWWNGKWIEIIDIYMNTYGDYIFKTYDNETIYSKKNKKFLLA